MFVSKIVPFKCGAGVFKRVRFDELFRGFDNNVVNGVDVGVGVGVDVGDNQDKQLKRDWSQQEQGFVGMR